MRKFNVRWWVEDPLARYQYALDNLTGEQGIETRYIHGASDRDINNAVRYEIILRMCPHYK